MEKKTIIRRRSLSLQLEVALRSAAVAIERGNVDAATQELIKTQLSILNSALKRERDQKLRQALDQCEVLRAENAALKAELARRSPSPADDIRAILERTQ